MFLYYVILEYSEILILILECLFQKLSRTF